ncbi:unnamed protein product [Rhodiola kirilowii]
MKGYKRKLATSDSMTKHLHNGGRTSFNFHPSPRMVPHIFKPEVQYVELSIEQFVHRGKAMKDDPSIQSPKPIDKLNDTEIQLLKMYFPTGGDCTWNPSLIAFPSCQSFPSRVYEVKHSFRTVMLIDAMQQLQGFSNIGNSRMISVEEAASPFQCAGGECISIDQSEFESPNKYMKCRSGGDANSFQSSPVEDKVFISEHDAGDYAAAENNFHCHLFRSEFVSVDPLGRISIMPAPILPYKEYVNSLSPQPSVADDLSLHNNKTVDPVLDEINQLPGTPELIKRISTNEDYDGETPDIMAHRPSIVECHVIKVDQQDVQLSPRLTNFMLSGVVPESPECGMQNDDGGINLLDPEFSSPTKHCRGALLRPSCVEKCEFTCAENGTSRQNFAAANKGTHTPRVCTNPSGIPMASPNILEELRTPLLDLTSDNCSNDWYPDSGNKSETLKKPRKLKRLRRHRDCLTNNMEHKSMVDANPSVSTFRYPHSADTDRLIDEVRGFIDEEAEVSSRSDVSGDEEDEKDCSSYDDSFIDDKTSLSEATTQAEAGSIDMMAIYRRSLLSQSPLVRQPVYNNTDPDFVAHVTNTTEKGSSSPKMMDCNSRRMIGHRINPTPCLGSNRLNSKGNVLSANPCSSSRSSVISGKRKLSAHQADIIPPMNLEKQFFASEAEVAIQTSQADKTDISGKLFYDDDFFKGLDLDAVEAQATLLLKNKAEAQAVNQDTYDEPGSPTFDLGI